jgi:Ig-like domain from next to BRCA1 gene
LNKIVLPGQEVDVTVDLIAPSAPGNYISFFRFVYGDNNRFGQKVWCDILVKPAAASPKPVSEEKKPEQSIKVDEIQVSSPVKLEVIKPEPLELQFIDVAKAEEPEVEQIKPALELSQSHFEEREISSLEEVKQEEPVIEEQPLMKSEPSAEELERINYLKRVESINDSQLANNLIYILDMGYSNFDVNLNLLKRNNNDLVITINSLCNGLVSDSMFA